MLLDTQLDLKDLESNRKKGIVAVVTPIGGFLGGDPVNLQLWDEIRGGDNLPILPERHVLTEGNGVELTARDLVTRETCTLKPVYDKSTDSFNYAWYNSQGKRVGF